MTKRLAASISLLSMTAAFPAITLSTPTANADECQYPAVGISANTILGNGSFCNYPTEINGSHLHCESGSYGFGDGSSGGLNISGSSCTWRCPDMTLAPAPNPPGAWMNYMEPQPNACADHMEPAGPMSEPVRADEGISPEGSPQLPGPPEPPDVGPGLPDALDPYDPRP